MGARARYREQRWQKVYALILKAVLVLLGRKVVTGCEITKTPSNEKIFKEVSCRQHVVSL